MKRDVQALRLDRFDLLVVGAGMQGAGVALAAARCGLRTALIDQGDFGHGASANSQKVMHGGLRYLQHLNLVRMRESIRARSALLRIAPNLVVPRAFLMPTAGRGMRSRAALRIALALNDGISADRNRGLPPSRRLPRGRLLSREECQARIPGLAMAGVDGAAMWYDGLAEDSERLTWQIVRAAGVAGAVVANYVRAERLSHDDGSVSGVEACDVETGLRFPIRAGLTLFTGGPWLSRLVPELAGKPCTPPGWTMGYNLVTTRPWPDAAGAAIEGAVAHTDPDAIVRRNKRNLFFVPWRGGTMVGTWYRSAAADPDACRLTAADIAVAVDEVRAVHPAWGLTTADVTMAHVGLLPARAAGSADAETHARIWSAPAGALAGLVVLQAVKYTTGVETGERVVRSLIRAGTLQHSGAARVQPISTTTAMDVSALQDWCRQRNLSVAPAAVAGLALRHGTGATAVLEGEGADDAARQELAPGCGVTGAEVLFAMREECALHLTDVVLRRTGLGTQARPPDKALEAAAAIMAAARNWTADQTRDEIEAVHEFYRRRGFST